MANLINTLYAPIVPTFMRAFPNNTDAVVYFTYSPLNNINQVKRIHVSLVDQLTNENALKDINGVLIYNAGEDDDHFGYDVETDMYYVTIPRKDIAGEIWKINQYYKVQLRLDANDEDDPNSSDSAKTAYLLDHQVQFSEWSSVCLIRPILQPSIQLRGLITTGTDSSVPAFNKGIIPINGKVFFGDGDTSETETLQSYVISILPRDEETVLYSTNNIYTGDLLNPNDINYRLDMQGIDTSTYTGFTLRLTITTKNQYMMSTDFSFNIMDFIEMTDFHPVGVNDDPQDQELRVSVDNDQGIASFRFINDVAIYGILYVKRSSSMSNFTKWETIYESKVADVIDLTITDNTVGSHIWYRYSIQLENSVGGLSQLYYTNIFFPEFYDAFLTRQDMHLPLRYDFKISNMRPIVNRSKIDTLGNKYPKFAENAVLDYKQFTIGGVISAEGDYHQSFLNKRSYYGSNYDNYRVYLAQNDVKDLVRNDVEGFLNERSWTYLTTTQDDWFWEREFREEVIKWLNDGEPKLFRSMTEGLMPVMITDVSLTPKSQLGRRLYDFTATMYEIADGHSLETLEALGIITIPKITQTLGSGSTGGGGGGEQPPEDFRYVTTIGQVYEFYPTSNNNIITSGEIYNSIMDKYNSGGIYSQREAFDIYIKNVQIYFHNDPRMFVISSNNNVQLITTPTAAQLNNKQIQMGYTFQLQTSDSAGWTTIFVNERGYYQIPENLNVTGLAFNQYTDTATGRIGDKVTVNYVVVYKERAAAGTIISGQTVDRSLVGQYQGVYRPNQYLGEVIRAKYNYVTELYTQRMQYWRGISIDVTPYAVAYIRYYNEKNYNEYLVGQTGTMNLMSNFPIVDMCFLGRRLVEQPIERQRYLAEHEYVDSKESYSSTNEIKRPKANTLYNIDGKDMIYYHNTWANFEKKNDGTGIAAVNVEGAINFIGDVIQITY